MTLDKEVPSLTRSTATPNAAANIRTTKAIGNPRWLDIFVCAFVLCIGAFQFTHYLQSADFLSDVTYSDPARTLLLHHRYEIRLFPETTLPPGLPIILAFVGIFFGFSPAVGFRVIAVSTAAGQIAAYELLRGRAFCSGRRDSPAPVITSIVRV